MDAIVIVPLSADKSVLALQRAGGASTGAIMRLSGINVWRTKIICLMVTRVFAATWGTNYSSLVDAGNPTIARGLELEVISAVMIGGIGLFGGKGTIWGAFIGVLFLGVLLNAMTLWGFDPYVQRVIKGGLILGAVFINFILVENDVITVG